MMLEHALTYAEAGLVVFPVRPDKTPYISQHAATTDQGQIAEWWGQWPDANIGHRLNAGVIILDIDPRHGGLDTWKALRSELPSFTTRTHHSGRGDGGGHVWFLRPGDQLSTLKLDAWAAERGLGHQVGARAVAGIDLVTREHRYSILPPSIHAESAKPYRWARGRGLDLSPVAMPAVLAELVMRDELVRIDDFDGFRDVGSIADWYSATHGFGPLLEREGWICVAGDGESDGSRWRHPEATGAVSATIRNGCLFVYSTNTPFEPTTPGDAHGYTPFRAYAVLRHDGDLSAAGRAARQERGSDVSSRLTPNRRDGQSDTSDTRHSANGDQEARFDQRRIVSGGAVLDQPEIVPAVWGDGPEVLWAQSEPLLIAAPPGVGKTTLAGQLIGGLVGLRTDVLGWPVQGPRRVLYVASDRPSQALRSLKRQYGEDDRAVLDDRLVIWKGPPPGDLGQNPELLTELCQRCGADAVVLDSLKDMAIGLTDDTVGAGLNLALQAAVAEGIEVCSLHHQRKGRDGVKPKTLEDVYGSTWITAGAGSVILLWGAAGDLLVDLIHLKQPVEEVGPLKIEHNHTLGISTVYRGFDALRFLMAKGPSGATATEAARHWFEKPRPNEREVAKARRKLDGLVERGLAIRTGPTFGGEGGSTGAVYKAAPSTVGAPTKPAIGRRKNAKAQVSATVATSKGENTDGAPTAPTPERESPGQPTDGPTDATNAHSTNASPSPFRGEGEGAACCVVCGGSEDTHEDAFHQFAPRVDP